MNFQHSQTAVLLFSQAATLDAARKGLTGPQADRNRALWETLHQLTAAKISAAGLPCVFSTTLVTASNHPTSFGEQLKAAVLATLAQGYDRVIVVGNDCPDLRVTDLRAAARALTQGQLPVGYDRRGGVYLLGIDRRTAGLTAGLKLFDTLPWQTDGLGVALSDYLGHVAGSVFRLSAVRADWNERADLRAGDWMRGAFAGLSHRVWEMVVLVVNQFALPVFFVYPPSRRTVSLRAPPVTA
jgi:uncharacterized protein